MRTVLCAKRLFVLVSLAGLVVLGSVSPTEASTSSVAPSAIGTALPPGWELCILQQIGAPATPENVGDLYAWQVAEGGSTDNSAAYNPFNTRRTTEADNAPLAFVTSQNTFPAFSSWQAGCAATVATLAQPNMAQILSALRAGEVPSVASFLIDVDLTQWCAPTNGTPCYESAIEGGGGASDSEEQDDLKVLSDTSSSLDTYVSDTQATASDSQALAVENQLLLGAELEEISAKGALTAAAEALRQLALYEYMDDKEESRMITSELEPFAAPSEKQVVAGVYANVDTSETVDRYESAERAFDASVANSVAHEAAVERATSVLEDAEAEQDRAMSALDASVTTIETAGACTNATASPVVPALISAPTAGSASGSAPVSTTTTATPVTAQGGDNPVDLGALWLCLATLTPRT